MRKFAVALLLVVPIASSGSAQSNATAGLAGLGAGAALGSGLGQSGTTPSSTSGGGAGGGTTPIEIQIMVFKGMADIARNIADLTVVHQQGCTIATTASFQRDSDAVGADRESVDRTKQKLDQDTKDTEEATPPFNRDDALIKSDDEKFQEATAKLAQDMRQLDKERESLEDTNRSSCAVLIEDPASANQIALYQAVQGYYGDLRLLHSQLQEYFSLQIPISSLSFPFTIGGAAITQNIRVTNVGTKTREVKAITVAGPDAATFDVNIATCEKVLAPQEYCDINVTFPSDDIQPAAGNYSATVSILSGHVPSSNIDSLNTDSMQTVQLASTVKTPSPPSPPPTPPSRRPAPRVPGGVQITPFGEEEIAPAPTPIAPATAAPSSTPSASGAPAVPIGLQDFGSLVTALGGLKSNITYGASSVQPTTPNFETLVENELLARGIFPYSSTSALDLKDATSRLTYEFGEMLAWGNDLTSWTNMCKPAAAGGAPTGGTQPAISTQNANPQSTSPPNSACTQPNVVANLTLAQQMIAGYTTLLSNSNDGSGNPVIVDVLRGRVLSDRMGGHLPALQLSIAAAGGSTKTNSIFGVNLFYTFAPSYNGGVIAMFELRDEHNILLESGARNVLFAYRKWESRRFHPREMKRATTCGSFCSVE